MSDDSITIETESPEQTERLGRAVAALVPRGVIALRGDLASGKTCFVRGMAQHVGAPLAVHSPTFTLINEYGDTQKLYHFDLYRLHGPYDVEDLGSSEFFEADALCAVEWAERAEGLLPETRVDIAFEHAGDDQRRITITNRCLLQPNWAGDLKALEI